MPTPKCPHCALVQAYCLCAQVSQIQARTRLVALQHPQETQHSKNTLRLAQLALPAMHCLVGEPAADFRDLAEAIARGDWGRVGLCYPADTATNAPAADARFDTLIVLDATWRKAHKMLMLNPWLAQLPRLSLRQQGNYRLRKTSVDGGLSTLESIAWALHTNEGRNPQPLLDLQARWIDARLKQMPQEVQARYEP
ncbi:tRNA-uridine aminocarboxypropyltransferase [Simiduia agarivorans]|uniref:tRNA-uridine aminocarboxypropyltransferase n=1 Tax=Simiduia agarivorans (strain DSM 21679 / JCM 13881 / BCRC 17597 / SA1) TaxID=1117647 RepID=K4KLJ8_SIMAS|nr:tRNA-uridine aminocarboxypropyltransferase [Simiduia agarivorans]AFU99901.1 DTW protein [Simiduia agarivorans SA1 = DSM 21679]